MKNISVNIKSAIKKSNYSQTDIANLMMISPQSVQQWCSGATTPSNHRLCKLADLLGITVDELINDNSVIPESEELGNRIQQALSGKFGREDGSLNFSKASKELNVSRQAVMNWLNIIDVNPISISTLNAVAIDRATKCGLNWLLTGNGNMQQQTIDVSGLDKKQIKAIKKIVKLLRGK